ncbi:MAG: hypothetical protein KDA58_05345 [Planctomycetaceae bacterium]|nr:hypothetical protein [Planctomycetaceae bacterium]
MSFFDRLLQKLSLKPASLRRRPRRYAEGLEDRTLLSNLNLLANGQVILGGGAEVNDFEVAFAGGEYTFTDHSGTAINPIGVAGFAALDTNPAANIVTFNAAAADALLGGGTLTQIVVNPGAGDDTTTVTSMRDGAEGLDVRNTAGQGTDTLNINGDVGTMAMPVTQNNVILRGETVNLNADVWVAAPFDIRLEGAVSLGTDVTLDAPAAPSQSIISAGTINGPHVLTIHGSSVDLQSEIGGLGPLAGLIASGDDLRVPDVTVTGDVTLKTDQLIFDPGTVITGAGNFTVAPLTPGQTMILPVNGITTAGFMHQTFGDMDTAHIIIVSDLVLGTDTTFVADVIDSLNDIDNAGNSVEFRGNTINLGNRPIVGGGDTLFTSLGDDVLLTINGDIGARYWSDTNVIVDHGPGTGGVLFNGSLGANVNDLTVLGAGAVNFTSPEAVNGMGHLNIVGSTISFAGGAQATGGEIFLNGDVILNGPGTFRVGAGNDFRITGGITANGNNIVIRGVGGGIGVVEIPGDVVGAGAFHIDSSGASTAIGVGVAGVDATSIIIRANLIFLIGDLHSATSVNLFGSTFVSDVSVATDAGPIVFAGTVDALANLDAMLFPNSNLVVNAGADRVQFVGAVGSDAMQLDSLTVVSGGNNYITANVTTSGAFDWQNVGGTLFNFATINAGGGFTHSSPFINKGTIV